MDMILLNGKTIFITFCNRRSNEILPRAPFKLDGSLQSLSAVVSAQHFGVHLLVKK